MRAIPNIGITLSGKYNLQHVICISKNHTSVLLKQRKMQELKHLKSFFLIYQVSEYLTPE